MAAHLFTLLYSYEFSHTDIYNNDWSVYYIFKGVTGRKFLINIYLSDCF